MLALMNGGEELAQVVRVLPGPKAAAGGALRAGVVVMVVVEHGRRDEGPAATVVHAIPRVPSISPGGRHHHRRVSAPLFECVRAPDEQRGHLLISVRVPDGVPAPLDRRLRSGALGVKLKAFSRRANRGRQGSN